jgi:hypothetical protein
MEGYGPFFPVWVISFEKKFWLLVIYGIENLRSIIGFASLFLFWIFEIVA